jgi:RNA polymerase sigma factor (sigma-70 family)
MGDEIGAEVANSGLSDEEVVRRVIEGEPALFEILMRRYNRRLFRVTRSIVMDDLEAEDIVQDAYVRAYEHRSQFEGRARFSTWLTKIAIYEAYARVRRIDYLAPMARKRRVGDVCQNQRMYGWRTSRPVRPGNAAVCHKPPGWKVVRRLMEIPRLNKSSDVPISTQIYRSVEKPTKN